MLQFVMGTAGTGKSTLLAERIRAAVCGGNRAILLVPEQLSFESEKRLYRLLGPRPALDVEVLSFTRLCNSIFRAFGGLAAASVTPAARYLLMSVAVEEVRDRLKVYRKSLANVSFLTTLVEACGEFKTTGIPPGKLEAYAAGCDGPLADKLMDLSMVYGAYQALLETGYTDPEDDLARACAALELHDFFGGCHVFVDGFTTFMAGEFELLGHAVAQAPAVTLALTCDRLEDELQGMGVFSPVQAAAARLTRIAGQRDVPVAPPVVCDAPRRFQGALAHIARWYGQPGAPAYTGGPTPAVRLLPASDRYGEVEAVVGAIAALVREEGYRYREIAVVTRDTAPYLRALEASFSRAGIPWFTDQPAPAENHPLAAGLLHAVNAVRSGLDVESVLLLAKCPICGLSREDVALLENYCYLWGVRGAAWMEPFTANPRGLAGPLTQEDEAVLDTVNGVRAALAKPLAGLREAVNTGTGRAFAAGLYRLLEELDAAGHLTAYADALAPDEKVTFLGESALVWDSLIDILDIFGTVLGGIRIPRARLCELWRLALGSLEIGLPPQTLDQVLVGKADRVRPVDLRAVFVIGAVEGEFPAQVAAHGVFSDAERRQMIEAGLEISAPTLQRSVLERFFCYFSLTLASRRLTVSWPRRSLGGQELLPSEIVAGLRQLLPQQIPQSPEQYDTLCDAGAVLDRLATDRELEPGARAAMSRFLVESAWETPLLRVERARRRPPHTLRDRALSRQLFGERMRLSPTRVERYYTCPFRYFAADGLALKPRRRVEFTPLESGSVLHHVLQVMVQRHGGAGLADLPEQQMRDEIAAVIRDYLAQRAEDIQKLPARFRYLFGRLSGMLERLLRHMGEEFRQSEFSPLAFELPISERDGVEPLCLETADGVQVLVEGVVDRVDIMEKNGRRYVRVVDYKSGVKRFELADILYGLNLQMLLYLFTIAENGSGALADTIPAGVLYMPVTQRFVGAGRDADSETVAAEIAKQWRMSGLLLEDEQALRGMERDVAGVFIPVKRGKGGAYDKSSSLAGPAEMGRLSRKVRELVVQMAASLGGGAIDSRPVLHDDRTACAYCDYRAVCGFEQGDPVREVVRLDRAQVFDHLRKEEEDG